MPGVLRATTNTFLFKERDALSMVVVVSTTTYLIPVDKLSDYFFQSVSADFKGGIKDIVKDGAGWVVSFESLFDGYVKTNPVLFVNETDIFGFLKDFSFIDIKGKSVSFFGFGQDSSFLEVTVA